MTWLFWMIPYLALGAGLISYMRLPGAVLQWMDDPRLLDKVVVLICWPFVLISVFFCNESHKPEGGESAWD